MGEEGSIPGRARRFRRRQRAALAVALALSLLLHVPLLRLMLWFRTPAHRGAEPLEVELLAVPRSAPPGGTSKPDPDPDPHPDPGLPSMRPGSGSSLATSARPKMDLWLRPKKPDLKVRPSSVIDATKPHPLGVPWGASRFAQPPSSLGGGTSSLAAELPGTKSKRGPAVKAVRGRADGRLADRYFSDLGKALLRAWDAERAVKARGLPDWLRQLGENAELYWKLWRERAESYGRTGTIPLPEATDRGLAQIDGLPDGPGKQVQQAAEATRWMRERSSASSRASIRVTHGANGALLSIELALPSGDPRIDADAVRDVRAVAGGLPRPPRALLRGRDRLVSLWELELETSVSPPTAALAVQWDEMLDTRDLRVPLDRRLYKRIRLVAYE